MLRIIQKSSVNAVAGVTLLAMVLLSACTGDDTPCRLRGESCGPSAGCCDGLSCGSGTCQLPSPSEVDGGTGGDPGDLMSGGPVCGDSKCEGGETQTSCCQDCGCPTDYKCQAKQCIKAGPTCGNNVCELGESSASCCKDCGCPNGQSCSVNTCVADVEVCGNGRCGVGENMGNCCQDCGCSSGLACERGKCRIPGTSDLEWAVYSNIYTQSINYRYFDETRGLIWPPSGGYYTLSPGGSGGGTLTCYTGDKICFGANGASTPSTYWGVSLYNNQSCTSCCRTCADTSTSITLTP